MAEEEGKKPWKPDRPISKGATAYHNAVVEAPHYIKVLEALTTDIVIPKLREGDYVVDFGAGTGVSSLCLLKDLNFPIKLTLVDNSAAWLAKAFEELGSGQYVDCYIIEKDNGGYKTLGETIGKNKADYVFSANTLHLIEDLEEVFRGIHDALKENGIFSFDSGNMINPNSPKGALMIDNTVNSVHDIALDIVRKDPEYSKYKKDIDEKIKQEEKQRKFVFPDPRTTQVYLDALKKTGFVFEEPIFKTFKVQYKHWLDFLRVKRLQAGILPEIGGHKPTEEEEKDRDELITKAANILFKDLEKNNPLADENGFTIEIGYVTSRKTKKLIQEDIVEKKGSLLGPKVALVTGGSRGIGKSIALDLAKNNHNIVINYNKDKEEAEKTVAEIKKLGVDSFAIKSNIGDFDDCAKMIEEVKKRFGKLHVLVNNAGALRDKSLKNMTKEQWDYVININLNGTFNVTKNALSIMSENGRIINISSVIGLNGNFGQTNYGASKAGIIGFTKSLAKELGRKKITVNAIAPGFIQTKMTKDISFIKKKMIMYMTTLGRFGTGEDIAHMVTFLASDGASFITGQVIKVDGGLNF